MTDPTAETKDADTLRAELEELIRNFRRQLRRDDLREKVRSLVPAFHKLRELGVSLVPNGGDMAARDRILHYFQQYPRTVINGDEIMVVAGIQDWPRRVRELRVEFGWKIVSGVTANEMNEQGEFPLEDVDADAMKPQDYVLLDTERDRDAAYRWNVANELRGRRDLSVRDRILEFLRGNVGQQITGEELRYIARGATEWARRVRELRTEYGWPVVTHYSGRPDLPVGVYLLEADRQSPEHDRKIPDKIRREVLRRDDYRCRECDWHHELWNPSDPRHLELHHIEHHAAGGESTQENLKTVCTVCHDEIHAEE